MKTFFSNSNSLRTRQGTGNGHAPRSADSIWPWWATLPHDQNQQLAFCDNQDRCHPESQRGNLAYHQLHSGLRPANHVDALRACMRSRASCACGRLRWEHRSVMVVQRDRPYLADSSWCGSLHATARPIRPATVPTRKWRLADWRRHWSICRIPPPADSGC